MTITPIHISESCLFGLSTRTFRGSEVPSVNRISKRELEQALKHSGGQDEPHLGFDLGHPKNQGKK